MQLRCTFITSFDMTSHAVLEIESFLIDRPIKATLVLLRKHSVRVASLFSLTELPNSSELLPSGFVRSLIACYQDRNTILAYNSPHNFAYVTLPMSMLLNFVAV